MKVRINDDAHGHDGSNDYTTRGSYGSWVEKYRGQVFKVVRRHDFTYSGIFEVIEGDKIRNSIHTSQATIMEETPIKTTFKEIPVNVPFDFSYKRDGVVCVKIDDNNYMTLEKKGITPQFKVFSIYDSHNIEVYPVKDYKVKFDTYVPKEVKNYIEFEVDNDRTVTIYKNGSVVLESNDFSYTKDKEEVEKIIKWGMTNYEFGHGLTPDSTLEVGCQKFTIKQIREFTFVYNSFVNGENNA